MRLLKIDPQARTVEAVESTGTLADMCRILDCQLIDVCARQNNGDALTVDDEALDLEPQPAAFTYHGYGRIHGVALLAGCDQEGGTAEPMTSIGEAVSLIEWLGEVYTNPVIEVFSL